MQNCKSKQEWFMIVAEPLKDMSTGKSLSEALIFAEHGENMLCS